MTSQTVTQAVAQRDAGAAAVVGQSADWFGSILPSHVDKRAFVALAKAHLRKDPKMAAAADRNPAGYMMALSECARLGLVPGDTFHIVPFENKRQGTVDLTPMVDYTGEIELIYRAGAVSSIKAEIVYSADHFVFSPDMDKPDHRPDWFSERGEMIGVYAYGVMKDGATSRVVVMSRPEVLKVKAVSKTANFDDSPWKKWEDRMWLKTAIHQLSKWVPSSSEYRREQLRAIAEADLIRNQPQAGVIRDIETGQGYSPATGEPVDAEIVDDPPTPPTDDAGWPTAVKPGEGS